MNFDDSCEFQKGDIIVEMGHSVRYRVVSACQTTDWYELESFVFGRWLRHQMSKSYIDQICVLAERAGEEDGLGI